MNKVYLAAMLACWGSAAMAAEQVEVNQVSDLAGAVSGAAKIGALGAGDGEFRKVRAVTLPNGQQRIRYEQTWQGIPVWGQVLVADQALDMAILKFRRDGAQVQLIGMNAASETLVDRLAIHDKPGALDKLTAH